MIMAILLAFIGAVVQRILLNQIDAYTKNWFFGGGNGGSSASSSSDAETTEGSSTDLACAAEPFGDDGVRIITAPPFYYFRALSVLIMIVWAGLCFKRQSSAVRRSSIELMRKWRGKGTVSTRWIRSDTHPPENGVPMRQYSIVERVPVYQPIESGAESTCCDQCTSYIVDQLGGWFGFLLFLCLSSLSFLYADSFRVYERIVVQDESWGAWFKSYLFSMPQKAVEVEGFKWATSLTFSFISGLVKDWWYPIAKGTALPVAGCAAHRIRRAVTEWKTKKTVKSLGLPEEVVDGEHMALRRQLSSNLAYRFRSSRDPLTAKPLSGMRRAKQWVMARVKSFVRSAKGRRPVSGCDDLVLHSPPRRVLTDAERRNIEQFRELERQFTTRLQAEDEHPCTAGDLLVHRTDNVGPVASAPAPDPA